MEIVNQILAPATLAIAAALVKAYIDIQSLKDKVQRLNEDRLTHEKNNEEQFMRLYDKVEKIYELLVDKHK